MFKKAATIKRFKYSLGSELRKQTYIAKKTISKIKKEEEETSNIDKSAKSNIFYKNTNTAIL